ncbi:MAG TPA: cytochrome C oxidase subunit IV family protein [Pirellulales bacterium]|nr:cytochrome C oxidase subunit IV family protein [Pirellulales bacterium]
MSEISPSPISPSPIALPPALSIPAAPHAGVQQIQNEQKRYLAVYATLICGTALTVAMYYVHFEALWQTVAVALVIAAVKAACVATIFMHLWQGQRDVYRLLLFTGAFAATMFALTIYSIFSLPGTGHYLR